MGLPSKYRTFYFDVESHSGEQFKGEFTIACKLSIRERHLMELEKTRILGGNSTPTNALMGIATMMATLHAHITKSPTWWTESSHGMDLEDENIVVELYEKIIAEQSAWYNELIEATTKTTEEVRASTDNGSTPQGNG
jgi:hypothetical protein